MKGGSEDTPPWSGLVFYSLLDQRVVWFNVNVCEGTVILAWCDAKVTNVCGVMVVADLAPCTLRAVRVVDAFVWVTGSGFTGGVILWHMSADGLVSLTDGGWYVIRILVIRLLWW